MIPTPLCIRKLRAENYHIYGNPCSTPTFPRCLDKGEAAGCCVIHEYLDHPVIVEACAPRHIPVMMEKPLAVSVADAKRIARAAERGGIPVIVNYETTWYASHGAAWKVIKEDRAAGEIRKMVAMDGHEGPREIGVPPEFFGWLTDPAKNGAGALFDFGCYGANLMTWMMDNARPIAVTAITQRNKPQIYPRVDDEATILVQYPVAGHHPRLMELAVQPQRLRSVRRQGLCNRDWRKFVARAAAGESGGDANVGNACRRRTRFHFLPDSRGSWQETGGIVIAGKQSDCDGDPRRRSRVRENRKAHRFEALKPQVAKTLPVRRSSVDDRSSRESG